MADTPLTVPFCGRRRHACSRTLYPDGFTVPCKLLRGLCLRVCVCVSSPAGAVCGARLIYTVTDTPGCG